MLRDHDWAKVTQETSWLSEDLNFDLPGLSPMLKPLHYSGFPKGGGLFVLKAVQ